MNTYTPIHKNTESHAHYKQRVFAVYALLAIALFLVGVYGALIGKAAFAASNVQKINNETRNVQSEVDSLQAKVAYSKSLISEADATHFGMSPAQNTEFMQKTAVGSVDTGDVVGFAK